jgi:hypothetical protein
MSGQQQFIMDSRLPVSETQSETDPSHPKNVMRAAKTTEMQANADTKYDIDPPPRVEGFENRSDVFYFFGSIAVAMIALCILVRASLPMFAKFALIAITVVSLHYAAGKLEKRTV